MRLFNRLFRRFNSVTETQQGQAIVLIAITGLVLLAFVGLAIDGGRLYFLKRDTQTAADAGGLAAARAMCTLRDYEVAGFNAVEANGFSNSNVDDIVNVYSPPRHNDTPIAPECEGCFVEVEVTRRIPPSFTQLVFDGPLEATSHSITMCNPDTLYGLNPGGLRAMWAGTDGSGNCQNNGTNFSGAGVDIVGGIHSNNILEAFGGGQGARVVGPVSYVGELKDNAGVEWLTEDDTLNNNQYTVSGACDISCFFNTVEDDQVYPWQNPYQTDETLDYPLSYDMADFRPDGAVDIDENYDYYAYDGSCTGNEKGIDPAWLTSKGLLTGNVISDGVYYSPCDIQLNNPSNLTGNVTLVAEGDIDVETSSELTAYYDNLLAFSTSGGQSCTGNNRAIKFTGSEATWEGNFFAPNGLIQMSLHSNTTANGCVVGYRIDLSGSSSQLVCDPDVDTDKAPALGFDY